MKRGTGNPWRRLRLPARVGWLVAGVYTLGATLVVTSSAWGWQGAYATRPVDDIGMVLCLLFGAACAGYAARFAVGRRKIGWLSLVAALLGWAVGQIIWAVYEVRPDLEHATHPAAAEIVLLLWPIGAMASMVLLSDASRHSPRRLALDGVIVTTSLFVASWVFVLDKQLREHSDARPATLVHVFNDIVLLTTAILMLSRRLPSDLPSRSLLAGGIVTISVADIAMVFRTGVGSYHADELADLGRIAGLGMIALAALSSVKEPPLSVSRNEVFSRPLLWLPYVPPLLAAAVGLGHAVGLMAHGPILVALGTLIAAILARQFVVLVENQKLLAEVAREAFRDSLTGLPNRAHFIHRLEEAVARRGPDTAPIAVLCLDLDNFKAVNDALGHPAGDELLVCVAGRLSTAVDDNGIVARLGGDEFAVLLEGSVEESQAAAHQVLEAFSAPIIIDGVPIAVRPSIGFTVAGTASACTVDQLLRNADLAMYTAKRQGGQCIRSFVPDQPLSYTFARSSDSALLPVRPGDGSDSVHTSAVASINPAAANPSGSRGAHRPMAQTLGLIARLTTPARDQPSDTHDRVGWPPMLIRIALALLAIGVIGFLVTSLLDPDASHSPIFARYLYAALNLLAAALIALRAYLVAADRPAWALIAAGMACSAIGDVVYALGVPDGESPSAADTEYLAFYPFVYVGLLLLIRSSLRRVPISIRLDPLVCALAIASLAVALRAGPFHAATTHAPATVLVGLIYPWADLVLLALAASMVPMLVWRNEFRWALLVAGLIGFAVADTVYLFQTAAGSYRVGSTLDAWWPAASLLIAMASWAPRSLATTPRRGLGSYAVTLAWAMVALGVAVWDQNSRFATTLAGLSLITVAVRFSLTFRDVRKAADSHAHAMTDELTALPNRRSLATALTALSGSAFADPDAAIKTSARKALLLVHVSAVDEVNDSVGRQLGDELLRDIANRLAGTVRRDDLLTRVSDDEFAILLAEGSDLIGARAQAGRLLDALADAFVLNPVTVQVDARIAIALYPDHCDHPQDLLSRAETAIAHAKSAMSKIAVYESAFEAYRDNDPNFIGDLRTALFDGDQPALHYQPKINASDGSIHSVEALLRWYHPTRGVLLPEEFLPAAERAGLMRMLSDRTLKLALKQIRSWRDSGIVSSVAVNLATTNLLDLELVGTIERLLLTEGLPPDALIIEITESALVDSARSRNTVAELRLLGVRISLDDYGTGWSSLARLQDVSVDELKLDRIFVARLVHDARSVAIVRSTVALADSLGADLVAEGVEDEVTLSALRRFGCTITQGYVHSPPLPPDRLEHWASSHVPQADSSLPEQTEISDWVG
jgi:diguanylate cyclase (GGDEF)-like protein